jgi:hypothetical protein
MRPIAPVSPFADEEELSNERNICFSCCAINFASLVHLC